MGCSFDAECPGWAEQPGMAFINLRPSRQRIAWMKIERHVELFDRGPERPVALEIVVGRRAGIAHLGEAISERAAEPKVPHAALEFADGKFWILHRQSGECSETVGALGNLVGEEIVGFACDLIGPFRIRDSL